MSAKPRAVVRLLRSTAWSELGDLVATRLGQRMQVAIERCDL